ncbi:MAG TPA: flavin-dependent oxidoreductase [Burkholderiales bacterium]|nr:flavin-dependent oxidoreductase [Burkholderiales bacterium]
MDVVIIGAGIGGLTLGLMLHRAGIPCRIYEAASELKAVGVGINILPHASRELCDLGLERALTNVSIITREFCFFNRFGQFIYSEPAGRYAGYDVPQFSIHRGDLQMVLLDAFVERAGRDRVVLGWRCTGVDAESGTARFVDSATGKPLESQRGSVVVSCEGIHSRVRKQLYPDEGPPKYAGINMWRGVTRWKPILTGASMIRIGWHKPAKLLLYPIRDTIDAEGRQLVNWVVDIETPEYEKNDWNRPGKLEDFIYAMEDWHFDWLDVPDFIRKADAIYEYPMVDQDPLPRWSFGRLTLLGDAAHPMYPRGANGAAQAILDCRSLSDALAKHADPVAALKAYEAERLPATRDVVLANRSAPPDKILQEVYRRTGDKPFTHIEDVISREELAALSESYKRVAGYDRERLKQR